jgi:hypothetical protein
MSIRRIVKQVGKKRFIINVPCLDSAGGEAIVSMIIESVLFLLEDGTQKITEDGIERIFE